MIVQVEKFSKNRLHEILDNRWFGPMGLIDI